MIMTNIGKNIVPLILSYIISYNKLIRTLQNYNLLFWIKLYKNVSNVLVQYSHIMESI